MTRHLKWISLYAALALPAALAAQGGFPGGFGGGPGGPGGPQAGTRKVMAQYDRDGNKVLDAEERKAAMAGLAATGGQGGRGRGGRGGMTAVQVTPGPRVSPADVRPATTPFYDLGTLRTLFLTFEDDNWQAELIAFNNTDIELAAAMQVDGKSYRDVGVRTRGASSFMMVPAGLKHSLNLSVDFLHGDQDVMGYRTINLLNANDDPTLLRTVLFYQIARNYLPALKANFVRVVINGESWGIYTALEQFNKDFARDNFGTTAGGRWKVTGSPGGRGGLEYLGNDPAAYRNTYEIKSKDDAKSWDALINLTRVLNTTPPEQLEAALAPILDVDGALKFLALDVALVNNDGFWSRASDYSIYQDTTGRFHVLPHDANETFPMGGGRGMAAGPPGMAGGQGGMRGGPPGGQGAQMGGPPGRGGGGAPGRGGGGPGRGGMMAGTVTLDPLVGLDDPAKALRTKLLAVPALRERYLSHVRDIATRWLDWGTLGPMVQKHHDLIAPVARTDTRKLGTTEAFDQGVATLRSFAEQRRTYLLSRD